MSATAAVATEWWPSRYGADDEAGALNEIGPEKVVSAAHLVRRGRVYDLAHVLHAAVPAFPGRTFTQTLDLPQAVPGPHGLGFVIERVHAPSQMGTHMDALNHLHRDGRTYNGHRIEDIAADHGTTKLGADTLPQVVTRGLLVDVAARRGVDAPRRRATSSRLTTWLASTCGPATPCCSTPAGAGCGTRTRPLLGRGARARASRWPSGWPNGESPSPGATRGATARCPPRIPSNPSSSRRP